jgi:MraZ protein
LNKIDKKGRISVPAPFRAVIAGQSKSHQDFLGIIAYGSFVNNCIEACSMERMENLSAGIDNLDPFSENRDAFATTILGGSVQLAFDGEGRITLPENMLKSAGITLEAIFVGKGKTFEIWHPETFAGYSAKAREIAKKERLGLHLATRSGQ